MTPRFWIPLIVGVFVLGCGVGLLLPRPQHKQSFDEFGKMSNDLIEYLRPQCYDSAWFLFYETKEIETPHWDTIYSQLDANHYSMTIIIPTSDTGAIIFGPNQVWCDTQYISIEQGESIWVNQFDKRSQHD